MTKWTPAALSALLKGDLENTLVALTPGGIEDQEARGQQEFVANETLPIKFNYGHIGQFETMGIVYGEPIDDLFVSVKLPDGWCKKPTGHSMWSDLIDDQGRKRASIFYKAAFYDRDAFVNIIRRYSYSTVPVLGYDNPDYHTGEWHCTVTDYDGTILWMSEKIDPEPPYPGRDDEPARLAWFTAWFTWKESKDNLTRRGKEWLDENFPQWEDPLAYW